MIGFAVIPFGPSMTIELFGMQVKPFVISDINIGILYILAFASMAPTASSLAAGPRTANTRSSADSVPPRVISYELNVGLAIVGVILLSGSLSLVKITEAQAGGFWNWFVIAMPFPQIFAFVVYVISSVAETNRVPFDLPEAESEGGCGILHGIQRHAVCVFLHRGIREHDPGLLCGCGTLPGRVERPIPARSWGTSGWMRWPGSKTSSGLPPRSTFSSSCSFWFAGHAAPPAV